MKGKIVILLALTLFIIGCGKETNSPSTRKNLNKTSNPINRTFEDLALGMSEDEFRSKLMYSHIPRRPYIVYSRLYNRYHLERRMKEIDNIYQVFCSFFNEKLYGITIHYNYDYHPSWEDFIFNAKQKYGKGKENAVAKTIIWEDGKTILGISEESGEQFDRYVSYYSVSYIDVEIEAQLKNQEKESSPEF